jgi:hypothetical protein
MRNLTVKLKDKDTARIARGIVTSLNSAEIQKKYANQPKDVKEDGQVIFVKAVLDEFRRMLLFPEPSKN